MKLDFNLIGGATWVLTIDDTLRLASDPALAPAGTTYNYKGLPTKRLHAPIFHQTTFDQIDMWLLTHNHFDHLDTLGLAQISPGARVISQANLAKKLRERSDLAVTYLAWGERNVSTVKGYTLEVVAMPARHGMNLFAKLLMGDVNGYLVTITNPQGEQKTLYFTADTTCYEPLMQALPNQVDVIVANLGRAKSKLYGGPFTMDEAMLETFMQQLQPQVTIAIHLDDFAHFETNRQECQAWASKQTGVFVPDLGATVSVEV